MKFAATFTSGAEQLILRQLKQFESSELQIVHSEPGLVIFESTLPPTQLTELRYFHNVWVLSWNDTVATLIDALQAAHKATWQLPKEAYRYQPHSFRLRIQSNGQPAAITEVQADKLHKKITATTHLHLLHHRADVEAWVVHRRSGFAFAGFLLPRPKFKRLEQKAGQLRPELAHILGLAAGVTSRDIVLDPFAGYGAIPLEIIASFSPQKVIAVEQSLTLVQRLQHAAKPSLLVFQGDALHLSNIADGSITRIVTDPPWGEFAQLADPKAFYLQFLQECSRLLKMGGIAVIVSAYTNFEMAITAVKSLEEVGNWSILVAGKKATIYKLRRR